MRPAAPRLRPRAPAALALLLTLGGCAEVGCCFTMRDAEAGRTLVIGVGWVETAPPAGPGATASASEVRALGLTAEAGPGGGVTLGWTRRRRLTVGPEGGLIGLHRDAAGGLRLSAEPPGAGQEDGR
ncbi:MAG: hypothetical protein R6V44_19045 [Paracoccaceae bacterium]